MNILLIGTPEIEILPLIENSNRIHKLFVASNAASGKIPNIEFRTISDLVQKTKFLQTDIAINFDNTLILDNLCEEFKKNRVNLISVNKKWLNLELSRGAAKQLLNHYSINNPAVINLPMNFPVTFKSDFPEFEIIINSKEELINNMEKYQGTKTFCEEYIDGKRYNLITIWDGKSSYILNPPQNCTEVQADRFDLFKTKLNFLLSDEKADFTGFFTTHLVWAKNDWYVKDFSMKFETEGKPLTLKHDFLYILDCAIYQKLNELIY